MSARTIRSFPVGYVGVIRSKEKITPSTGGAGCRKINTFLTSLLKPAKCISTHLRASI